MITLAISNQKGGVGKTTTTQHMAAVLGAEHHSRVLAVDLDPQFNLTKAAGVDVDHLTASVYQVLVTQAATLRDVIQPTEQGYDIAPADPRLGSADIELVSAGRVNWHLALRKALATLGGSYDWVLLDCPPALGTLTVNALHAAHGVVIPVTPELWPISGMQLLFSAIQVASAEGNPGLEVLAAIPTMVRRGKPHTGMLERMQTVFEGVPIGPSVMLSDHFQSAALAGTTVIHRSPSSAAAASYRNVTEFVVRAVEARQRRPATRILVGA